MLRSILLPQKLTSLASTLPILRPSTRICRNFSAAPVRKMEAPKNMSHFKIDAEVKNSSVFRRVLWTGTHSQLVIMNVPVGGEIGEEVHTVDQHLTFTSGSGRAIVNGKEQEVSGGSLAIVPAGAKHNFVNTGDSPLLLYTVYAPAEHDPRTVHKTKEEGDKLEEEGKDEAPKFK